MPTGSCHRIAWSRPCGPTSRPRRLGTRWRLTSRDCARRSVRERAEARRARADGDAEFAARALHEADGLWRGRPLADLEFEPFARVEVERLEELRLVAIEERIDADMALGRVGELVAGLRQLTREHPWRERLHAQLMLALY